MLYASLKTLHLICLIVWLGGMVFVQFFLRPALGALEAPVRLRLMHDVLGRFFNAVLLACGLVLGSGLWMVARRVMEAAAGGGKFAMPPSWTLMAALGLLMMAIFGHIRFALYARLSRNVLAEAWPAAGAALARIRGWVLVNLGLGLTVVVLTLLGLPR